MPHSHFVRARTYVRARTTCECGIIETECPNLRDIRQKVFTMSSIKDLLENVNNRNIVDFIYETHFTVNNCVCYFRFTVAQWP